MKRIRALLFTGMVFITQALFAGPYEDALHEIENGNYAQGYTLLKPLAEAGDAEAQYLVGSMIIDNSVPGVSQTRGVYWLEKAVENQHMDAAQSLSKMYLSGHVVSFDTQKGIEYQALANEYRPSDKPVEDCD